MVCLLNAHEVWQGKKGGEKILYFVCLWLGYLTKG